MAGARDHVLSQGAETPSSLSPPPPPPSPLKQRDNSQDNQNDDGYMYFPVSSGLTLTDVIAHSLTQRTIRTLLINTQPYEGEGLKVDINGHTVTIFFINNTLYCIDEKCPHAGGPLHLGDIEDNVEGCGPCITCPWHRYCFQLKSGHILHPQKRHDLQLNTYPIKVNNNNGQLLIGFKSFRPSLFKDIEF